MQSKRTVTKKKGQGQEQAEMLALDRGREALLPKRGEGRGDGGRWGWNARIVSGGWMSPFQRTSLFHCELGGEVVCCE